jgi:hypothetical protein
MSGKLLFYYLGDDEAYFRALQGEFRTHAKIPIEFIRISESSESQIQSLFLSVFTGKPSCVFIDFSKMTQDYLHLARLLSRTPLDEKTLLVGLVDYLSPPEVLRESIATGVVLNYIKSAETFDVVFGVLKVIAPQSMGEHGFANASLKEDWTSGVLCKIGYIQSDGVHIETDFQLSKGDRIKLRHHWMEKRMVPSKDTFVKDVSNTNMFYQFRYNADLEFLFVDDFIPPAGMEEIDIKAKEAERQDAVQYHKKQLKKWLEDNLERSQEKKAKVLVVDLKFNFYQNQARTDKHPYTIRCIPCFNDIAQELDRLRPQVIAFAFDKEENPRNTMESLSKLVAVLNQSFATLKPFIIVFNTDYASAELQQILSYSQVICDKGELSPEIVIRMSDMLQKKLLADKTVVDKNDQYKVFIKKNNLASLAEIEKSVTVIKLSESDMMIQSEIEFPEGTNLHFTHPVEMFVYLQPAKASGKVPEYYGLIHSLGEIEKKELRRYVNTIFFRDHDAQVNAETEEFKKLNDAKLQEKLAALKKANDAAEAAEAKAQAEAEDKAKKVAEVPEKPKEEEAG